MLAVYPDLLGEQAPPPLSPQLLSTLPVIAISEKIAGLSIQILLLEPLFIILLYSSVVMIVRFDLLHFGPIYEPALICFVGITVVFISCLSSILFNFCSFQLMRQFVPYA